MSNGIGRVWAVNAEGGDEGRPNGVGPVYIENADQLGSKLPEPAAGDAGKVLGVLNSSGDIGWVEDQSGTLTQIQSDWDEDDSSQVSYIQNKPTLAAVATSGSYADLSNKPTIPTVDQVYDSTSANAQSGVAVASAISGKQDTISDLETIRSGAAAGATAVQPSQLATVATSGSYADLSNKPSIPAAQVQSDWNQANDQAVDYIKNKPSIPAAQVNSDWNAASGVAQILNKPSLATVATSGSYNDLTNKPTIPAAQVQSDWNQTNDQAVDFIKNKPTIPSGVVVDQTYSASSTNAQSGTAVAGALSTINQVPASTSADEDKVLTVDSNGDAVWAAAQGGGGGTDVTVDTTNNNIEFGDDIVLHYTVTYSGSMTWTGSRNDFSGTLFEWRWDNSEPAPSATLTLTIPNNISRTGNAITSVVFKDVSNSTCTVSGGTLLSNGVIQAGTYTVTASSAFTTVRVTAVVTFTNSLGAVDATLISAAFDETTLGITGGTPTADLMPNVARTSSDNGKVLGVTDTSGTLGWVAQTPAQIQSDWNQTNDQAVDFIKNKPTITAGDGIAISGSNAISAKVGDGLEIGSHAGSAVTANMSAIAYRGGEPNPYLSYVMPLTSDLVNKIETSGISVTLSKVANADWECYYANSNSFPVILTLTPNVGADYGTRLVLSNTGYSIVDNKLQAGVAYDFNLDDINTSMSNTTWASIKANPTNYALSFIHSSSYGGYGVIYNGGNNTLSGSTSYTTGSYSYAVVEQGFINVSNPVPAFDTTTDEGKVLTVGSNGTEWVNNVPIEVVASMPANPTSGVLYIVTGA